MVVDLAVEHRPDRAPLVGDRLVATLHIDHAEPPRADAHAGLAVRVDAFVVGPTVPHRLVHRSHRGGGRVVGPAADAAHLGCSGRSGDVLYEPLTKAGAVPLQSVRADRGPASYSAGSEAPHRGLDRVGRLLDEELAGHTRQRGVERAAACVGEHRPAAGHRLDRDQAEVVAAGEDQRLAALHQGHEAVVVDMPEELDVRRRGCGEALEVGTAPGDHEALAEPRETPRP